MWRQPMRAMQRAVEGLLPMITLASHSLHWTSSLLRYAPEEGPLQNVSTSAAALSACLTQLIRCGVDALASKDAWHASELIWVSVGH